MAKDINGNSSLTLESLQTAAARPPDEFCQECEDEGGCCEMEIICIGFNYWEAWKCLPSSECAV